jgi:hypothetical protein
MIFVKSIFLKESRKNRKNILTAKSLIEFENFILEKIIKQC